MRENKETQQKSPFKRNQAETDLYNVPCVRLCDMMSEVFFMQEYKSSQTCGPRICSFKNSSRIWENFTYKPKEPKVIMKLGISSK